MPFHKFEGWSESIIIGQNSENINRNSGARPRLYSNSQRLNLSSPWIGASLAENDMFLLYLGKSWKFNFKVIDKVEASQESNRIAEYPIHRLSSLVLEKSFEIGENLYFAQALIWCRKVLFAYVGFYFIYSFISQKKKKSVDLYQDHYLYVANLFGCDFSDSRLGITCVSWRSTAIQPKQIDKAKPPSGWHFIFDFQMHWID